MAGCALLALGAPLHAPLGAQGTALVPLSDPAYHALDRLDELLPLAPYLVGQRPYPERELCRLAGAARAAAAQARPDARERELVEQLVARLEGHCTDRRVAGELALLVASTDAPRRPIPASIGSYVEATIGTIGPNRPGTPLRPGTALTAEVAERVQPLAWLAVSAAGRVEALGRDGTLPARGAAELLGASVRARAGNLAILVGRERVAWAQRTGDGFFLASDSPALDQVALSSERPFLPPGFLRRLGPTRGTLLLADLGASVSRSHSRLLAYKVSVQPSPALELGGTFLNHFGGEGHAPAGFVDQLIDFLPFVDVFRRHAYDPVTLQGTVDSDKVIGIDGRLRLAVLGGVTLAGEWLVDDFDANKLSKLLTNLGSHSLAVIVPRVGTPALSMTLSAKHMGLLTSTHATLLNGMAVRGRLLGDELGPDAKAFALSLDWTPSSRGQLTVEARSAIHSKALYSASYVDAERTLYEYATVSREPDELRDRLLATATLHLSDAARVSLRAGGQRVRNADFLGGRRRDYLLELGMHLRH